MPTLELIIDATGMTRGAQAAEQALRIVQDSASKTAGTVQGVQKSLNSTFVATQGGVAVATGISQTAQAFQSMNLAMAGFAGARTLLEIGQTAQQISILRGSASAASVAMLTLGRAIPYVGLALSVVAAAYSIFGNRVEDTTKKVNDQVDALGRLQSKISETNIRVGYGEADPRKTVGGAVDVLAALRASDPNRAFTAKDAAGLFGVTEQELRYSLARSGLGEAALEYRPGATALGPTGRPIYSESNRFQMQSFTRGQIIGAGEDIFSQRRGLQPVTSQGNTPWEAQQGAAMSRSWQSATQANTDAVKAKQDEADRAHLEALQRQIEMASQLGAALGAGVFDVLAGIQGWRQALANIAGSFAKQGLANLGSSFAANLFGGTKTQGVENITIIEHG